MSISNINICRACLAKCPEDKVIFETLKNVFIELTSLQETPTTELPRFLCGKCGDLLTQFKTFKETCIESDTHLRNAVSNATFPLLLVESIKVERQAYDDDDDEDVPLRSLLSPPLKRKRKPAKKPETHIDRRKTRANQKSSQKQEKVEDTNESSNQEDDDSEYQPEHDKDQRRTRVKNKSTEKVESSNESDNQGDEINETKQEVSDTSDEEFEEPPKVKAKRTQPTSKPKVIRLYSCTKPNCKRKFQYEHNLEAHLKKHDGIDPRICDICERPLTTVRNMVRHRLTHKSLEDRLHKCKVCYKVMMSEKTLEYHMKSHEAKPFVCDICGLGYVANSALKAHKQTHNTDSSFKCNLCPKAYTAYASLFMHIKAKHEKKETPVECNICGRVVASKKFLFSHCRNKHTVYTTIENIFQCKQCGLKCKSTRILKRHEELHTGERKYKCPLCPKAYAHLAILKKHSYSHTGERPFHCEECGKGFLQKYALDVHMNVHKRQWIAQGMSGITLMSYSQTKKKGTNISTAEFGDHSADSSEHFASGFMGIDQN